MKKALFLLSFFLVSTCVWGQGYRLYSVLNSTFQYNTFLGSNQKEFQTTPKALGSGVYDFSAVYAPLGIWFSNPNKKAIGVGFAPGIKVSKFRFLQNYTINSDYQFEVCTDPGKQFYTGFFNRDGSKLTVKSVYLPLVIMIPVSRWFNPYDKDFGIFIVPFFENIFYAHHKLIYHNEEGKLNKEVKKFDVLRNVLTLNNYGMRAGFKIKSFYFFAQYSLENFFKNGNSVNEFSAGINFDFWYWLLSKTGNDDDDNTEISDGATSL